MDATRIRISTFSRSVVFAFLSLIGCAPADPLAGASPFATMGCGGYYLAVAADPATSATDRAYYEALADGLAVATTAYSPASRNEVKTEMVRWRDEWQRELRSDWAQTAEGRAENANFVSECAELTASLPTTRNITRAG
ncbi:hypothetical protein [Yoonia sp. 2307UL14-13]|uniref:hypothetical protein n=1 Tax=Yoonia sp. 2307UL14-13 TaxID=3126506 RepID=UPI0030A9F5FA